MLNREDPIIVWGSGDQQRDFIYIEDVVDAVLHTYNKLLPGEALNFGTGVGTSFRELADAAREILDVRSSIGNDASKPEGVFRALPMSIGLVSIGATRCPWSTVFQKWRIS